MANFKYVEHITTSQDLLGTLKSALTFNAFDFNASAGETEEKNAWKIVNEVPDQATGKIKELVIEGTAKIGTTGTKVFQVKLTNPGFATPASHSSLIVQQLKDFDKGTATEAGHPVKYEWAKENATPKTDRDMTKPVYMYLNIMNNRLAMILVGDPAINFEDYRKSFLYVGAIKPFKYNENDDVAGNVLLTAGSVTAEPTAPAAGYDFGQYTSYGNNTFQMFMTKSGIRFQKHYPSFITQAPQPGKAFVDPVLKDTGLLLEPQGFNASAWSRKYHMSPIYIVHPYDGYRGQLEYVISVSKNNILHLDELIVDIPDGTAGKKWKQEVYRYFDHNTEQNFMNMSANVKMGVAFLKEVRY
ncbi:hypothetical protein [Paenibacillus sp. NPDC058071]|uniref:hypothetical protein n=1 Tax=Paenibacillus sp. NPDC058071 TaxID=3346326 RepID=UPI0036DCF104